MENVFFWFHGCVIMIIERVALSSSIINSLSSAEAPRLYFRQFSGTVLNNYSLSVIELQLLLTADIVNLLQV